MENIRGIGNITGNNNPGKQLYSRTGEEKVVSQPLQQRRNTDVNHVRRGSSPTSIYQGPFPRLQFTPPEEPERTPITQNEGIENRQEGPLITKTKQFMRHIGIDVESIEQSGEGANIFSSFVYDFFNYDYLQPLPQLVIPGAKPEVEKYCQQIPQPAFVVAGAMLEKLLDKNYGRGVVACTWDVAELYGANHLFPGGPPSITAGDYLLRNLINKIYEKAGEENGYCVLIHGDELTYVAMPGFGQIPTQEQFREYAREVQGLYRAQDGTIDRRPVEIHTDQSITSWLISRTRYADSKLKEEQRIKRFVKSHPEAYVGLSPLESIHSAELREKLLRLKEDAYYDPYLQSISEQISQEEGVNVFVHINRHHVIRNFQLLPENINQYSVFHFNAPHVMKRINDDESLAPHGSDEANNFLLQFYATITRSVINFFRENEIPVPELRYFHVGADLYLFLSEQTGLALTQRAKLKLMDTVISTIPNRYTYQIARIGNSIPVISGVTQEILDVPRTGDKPYEEIRNNFISLMIHTEDALQLENWRKLKEYYSNPDIPRRDWFHVAEILRRPDRAEVWFDQLNIPDERRKQISSLYSEQAKREKKYDLTEQNMNLSEFISVMKEIFEMTDFHTLH